MPNERAFIGEIWLRHARGDAYATVEIPFDALTLPRAQLIERYIAPAFAQTLDAVRRQRDEPLT